MEIIISHKDPLERRIIRIISRHTAVPRKRITSEDLLTEQLGLTSMDRITIISEIEFLYRITFGEYWDELVNAKTVSQLVSITKETMEKENSTEK